MSPVPVPSHTTCTPLFERTRVLSQTHNISSCLYLLDYRAASDTSVPKWYLLLPVSIIPGTSRTPHICSFWRCLRLLAWFLHLQAAPSPEPLHMGASSSLFNRFSCPIPPQLKWLEQSNSTVCFKHTMTLPSTEVSGLAFRLKKLGCFQTNSD